MPFQSVTCTFVRYHRLPVGMELAGSEAEGGRLLADTTKRAAEGSTYFDLPETTTDEEEEDVKSDLIAASSNGSLA